MSIILTITKNKAPIQPSIRFNEFKDADQYLRTHFGTEQTKYLTYKGHIWFNGEGVSRIVLSYKDTDVKKALPKAKKLTFFLDSEKTYAVMSQYLTNHTLIDAE